MSAYPIAGEVLVEKVAALGLELAEWPSRRRIMRTVRVGRPRADAALAELRRRGFEPRPERGQEQPELHGESPSGAASDDTVEANTEASQIAVEPLVDPPADAVTPERVRTVPRWPLLIIAAGAFVAVWGGWTGLGKLTGFGDVRLLPGIADQWVIDSAITLPINVEAYGALALWCWLTSAAVAPRARRFARDSAIGSLALGALGQVAYHLLTAAGVTVAPWWITAAVAVLPVAVLGCAAALVHLIRAEAP